MTSFIDLLIYNSAQLLTLAGPARPRVGREMEDLGNIPNGAIAIHAGKILETGTTSDLVQKYPDAATQIDAHGKLILPGFVDSHTHLVFAGSREHEMMLRLQGATYLEILQQGGGIHSTVNATRSAGRQELLDLGLQRLNLLLQHGTTTVEIKSGYGLDRISEQRILEVIQELGRRHPMDIVATFLGAHAVPQGVDRSVYVQWIIAEALDAYRHLAEYCDVFCEEGAFTVAETQQILAAAKANGYKLKIHAGQFNDLEAAGLAAELQAVSADHLEYVSLAQLEKMKAAGTIAVLLPGVPFFLLSEKYPPARLMLAHDVPVAIATDFNPGSCPSFSMPMMMTLACLKMKMTAAEAIIAGTYNAACAIDRQHLVGSLEPGKQADIIVLNMDEPEQLPYYFGANLTHLVVKAGKVAYQE